MAKIITVKTHTIYILLTIVIALFISLFYAKNRKIVPTQNLTNELSIFTDIKTNNNPKKKDLIVFNSFIENAVIFKGTISKIKLDRGSYTMFVYSNKIDQELICSFQLDQNKKINYLKKGDFVTIKGIYKGFLKNMIFHNCILY